MAITDGILIKVSDRLVSVPAFTPSRHSPAAVIFPCDTRLELSLIGRQHHHLCRIPR